jgi:hypothetical protein
MPDDPITREWAREEVLRWAQQIDTAYTGAEPDPLESLRALMRATFLHHILAALLLEVVTDAEFNRIRDEFRAVL